MKENKIREAFSQIRAPEGVLREVNMKIEQEARRHEKPRRYGKLIPIAAVLAAVLALSAAAYGFVHSDFYKNAFGTGVESHTGGNIDLYDADGNYVKSNFVPSYERVEVDPEKAEKLVGDAVTTINKTFELNDYTVTVIDALLDDNGVGYITVDIEHPEGHTRYSDWYMENIPPYCECEYFMTEDGDNYGHDCTVVQSECTDTKVRLVYNLAPIDVNDAHKDLKYVFNAATEFGKTFTNETVMRGKGEPMYSIEDVYDSIEIPISIKKRVKTIELSCNDKILSISPLGAWIDLGDEATNFKTFVITYTDGTEYIVKDDEHSNMDGGINNGNGNIRLLFNRLVEVDIIDRITVTDYSENELVYKAS